MEEGTILFEIKEQFPLSAPSVKRPVMVSPDQLLSSKTPRMKEETKAVFFIIRDFFVSVLSAPA